MLQYDEIFLENSKVDKDLFAIDGGDFSGKSSVCELLKNEFIVKRLPGATEAGESIRNILKNNKSKHPETIYYLLSASDAEFFCKERESIKGKILLDRSWISRIIYQSEFGIGIISLKRVFTDLFYTWNKTRPYKTVILTCSENTLQERINRRKSDDWFDSFADVTRKLYIEFCKEYRFNVKEICTDGLSIEQVAEKVREYFNEPLITPITEQEYYKSYTLY